MPSSNVVPFQYTARLTVAVVLAACAAAPVAARQSVTGGLVPCEDGRAGAWSCERMSVASFLTIQDIGGGPDANLNDIWGWTDEETGRRYALVGRSDGTAFVDVTDPVRPAYVGSLPRHGPDDSLWRDIKVYRHWAYVVSEASGHGVQVFDLHALRGVTSARVFEETSHFFGFGSAHNIAIDEEAGFAYAVGARGGRAPQPMACAGGLVMLDLSDPVAPAMAGCFNHPGTGRSLTGYVHDTQCVVYDGPDVGYRGREICFGSNETALSIADVTDKANPVPVGLGEYPGVRYAHQGWLSEDHRHFFLGDELDELATGGPIRTLVFDVSVLSDPVLAAEYRAPRQGIDHNMYTTRGRLYQANYKAGIQVLDVSDPEHPVEVGRFDTTPVDGPSVWDGTWSVYPFFGDDAIVASSIGQGLFVLTFDGASTAAERPGELPGGFTVAAAWPNPFATSTRATVVTDRAGRVRAEVVDVLGRVRQVVFDADVAAGASTELVVSGDELAPGPYLLRVTYGDRVLGTSLVRLP